MDDQQIKVVLQEILNPLGRRLDRSTLGCGSLCMLAMIGSPVAFVMLGGGNWWLQLVTGVGASFLGVIVVSVLVYMWQNKACRQALASFNARFPEGSMEREKAAALVAKMARSFGSAAAELHRYLGGTPALDGIYHPVEKQLGDAMKSIATTPGASVNAEPPPTTKNVGRAGPASYPYIPLEPVGLEPSSTAKPQDDAAGSSHERNSGS